MINLNQTFPAPIGSIRDGILSKVTDTEGPSPIGNIRDMLQTQVATEETPTPIGNIRDGFVSDNTPTPIGNVKDEKQNIVFRILDVLNAPQYGIANAIKDAVDGDDFTPLKSFYEGLSLKEKYV